MDPSKRRSFIKRFFRVYFKDLDMTSFMMFMDKVYFSYMKK